MEEMDQWILTYEKRVEKIAVQTSFFSNKYQDSKIVKLKTIDYSKEQYQPLAV